MGGFVFGLVGLALIWAGVQLTLSPGLKADLDQMRVTLAAAPPGEAGSAPIAVSADLCTMLTAEDGVKRGFSRLAFLSASRAAENLRKTYRFEPLHPCRRGGENAVSAYPAKP